MKRRFARPLPQTPASLATQLPLWNEPARPHAAKPPGLPRPPGAARARNSDTLRDALPADIRALLATSL